MTDPFHVALGRMLVLAQAPAEEAARPAKTLLDHIHDGGTISYLLVVVSLIALTLLIRNMIALRPAAIAPPYIFDELIRFARSRDLNGALEFCNAKANRCVLSAAVGGGLERAKASPLGVLEMREGMEQAGRHEVDELHRMNDGVGIIAAVGPMLGLLGTVVGMIGAFGTISELQGAARSSELARFMSMALVCTAEGLIVAIPCTIAFALFRRRIDRLASLAAQDAEEVARVFMAESAGPALTQAQTTTVTTLPKR